MTPDKLPEDVAKFITTYIDSIEQLKVLLLLFSEPDRAWSVKEITAKLTSAETSIERRLEALYVRKVLHRLSEFQRLHKFTPISEDVKTVIGHLSEENLRRPYQVIEAIYSGPTKDLEAFADAFKLRGSK